MLRRVRSIHPESPLGMIIRVRISLRNEIVVKYWLEQGRSERFVALDHTAEIPPPSFPIHGPQADKQSSELNAASNFVMRVLLIDISSKRRIRSAQMPKAKEGCTVLYHFIFCETFMTSSDRG